MADLFSGELKFAPTSSSSTTETPLWMQNAIFEQLQAARNVSNTPYQPYSMPTVAGLSPLQQQAYTQVQGNQGNWKPQMDQAWAGMSDMSQNQTAGKLQNDQSTYLNPNAMRMNQTGALNSWQQAGDINVPGAAQPYMDKANAFNTQAMSDRALNAANPYMQAASQSSASNVQDYMNPYNDEVAKRMATLGARNLSENLLPAVSDSFVRAGSFGGSRMGEFGSRALRDTQDSVLAQQAQLLQQGYGQSLNASQADLSRQAQLAGTAGSIAGGDLSRVLQGAGQYGNLASTAGSLAGQQMQNLSSLGNMQNSAAQAQQQFGLNSAQAVQQAYSQDFARQQSALQAMAGMAQQRQGMGYADTAALESAGQAQQGQLQKQLTSAEQQYLNQQNYPKQQLDWMNTQLRGMAPITPQTVTTSGSTGQYGPSPLSQLASGLFTYNGLTGP